MATRPHQEFYFYRLDSMFRLTSKEFFTGSENSELHRMRFLHESLEDLDESFKGFGGRLYTFQGETITTLKMLFEVSIGIYSLS